MGLYIYISSDDFGRSLFNIHINIIVPKDGKMKTIGKMYTVRQKTCNHIVLTTVTYTDMRPLKYSGIHKEVSHHCISDCYEVVFSPQRCYTPHNVLETK